MMQQPVVDDHVFLVGRPPMGEYLGFVTTQAAEGHPVEVGTLAEEWRTANDHISQLQQEEPDWADNVEVGDVPEEQGVLRDEVLKDSTFKGAFQVVPSDIGMVELDRLVVFQRHINLAYVAQLKEMLGDHPNPEEVFRFCLPLGEPRPRVNVQRIAGNAYVFVSPSNDLRFMEPVLLRPDQVVGYTASGPMSAVVGLVFGYGINCVQVIAAEGRLVLGNGSHRAYALRDLGVTHVPCVVQRVSRREELPIIISGDLENNPDAYLTAPRPPVLKDYFDQHLRKIVPVPRQVRQVRMQFAVEQFDTPVS